MQPWNVKNKTLRPFINLIKKYFSGKISFALEVADDLKQSTH